MDSMHVAGRRKFLQQALAGAVMLGVTDAAGRLPAAEPAAAEAKSRVVVARDPLLRGSASTIESGRLLDLLDRAVQTLFDRDRPIEAWRKLVRPGEFVALKVNTLGGRGISTHPQLAEVICERLQEAGIKAGDIVVWDRDSAEMEHAGFHLSMGSERVQCFGTDRVDYEQDLTAYGSVASRLSKILTRRCSALINLPVLKDHDGAGVTIALKNMYGAVHNPNKYHPDGCDPYIADLNMLPEIRTRMRLIVCDATTAMYEGGPAFKPEHSWQENALIVSQDPVALDYTGWQIIERKRAQVGLKTLEAADRAPRYIATAADAQHRLGRNDPTRISTVEV